MTATTGLHSDGADDAAVTIPHRRGIVGVTAWLTAAKVAASASGFVTGPLLARALGAPGRGDLAAIQVPVLLGPAIIGLGIASFAYHELPRGRRPEVVLGSLGLPLLAIGLVAAAAAVPVADALAGSRATVRTFLIVGFMLMPLLLLSGLLTNSLTALQRWRAVIAATVLPFVPPFVGDAILYALGDLTVGRAAALMIAGALLPIVPALPLLFELPLPRFRLSFARAGVEFGVKAWAGGLAVVANARLDQLLMITLVAPRVLGLYAVATTLSGATGLVTGALAQPLMPRIAGGERLLLPRAARVSLAVTVVLNAALALITPLLIVGLFGPGFAAAVPMALVLLVGAVPLSVVYVLSSALQADGAPLIPTIGELVALVVTVVGLLLVLKPLGGIGAAIVSDLAYATSFSYQVVMAGRRLEVPLRAFLLPTRSDLQWAASRLPRFS